ncbi:hypothetical protein A2U01_0029023, partial [Trifolium medium]|nr:hypothetical protein [Trifolium medium]
MFAICQSGVVVDVGDWWWSLAVVYDCRNSRHCGIVDDGFR